MKSKKELRSITFKDEIEGFEGKHCLLPFGMTLCGLPSPEAPDKFKEGPFADLVSDFIEHKGEDWNITCKKCIEVFSIIEQGEAAKKAKRN